IAAGFFLLDRFRFECGRRSIRSSMPRPSLDRRADSVQFRNWMRPEGTMPEKAVIERAKKDLRAGKSPSTAAGEFVREKIKHVRRGKHGARSPRQAIAIGLSKARRAGIPLPPPGKGDARRAAIRRRRRAKRR